MKVVVQPTRFQIEIGGKWFEASEQEARELWAKLNEHFGAKSTVPAWPLSPDYQGYWDDYQRRLKVTCEQTQVPPGISVG